MVKNRLDFCFFNGFSVENYSTIVVTIQGEKGENRVKKVTKNSAENERFTALF